jgi:DNA-binding protein Fis
LIDFWIIVLYLPCQDKRANNCSHTWLNTKTLEDMQNVQVGDKRSVALEATDKSALRDIMKYAVTQTAAADLLRIGRGTLIQLLKPGSRTCAPDTRDKIREFAKGNPGIVKRDTVAA